MGYEKKITHVKEGLENLLDQFKGKPKIEVLLTSYLKQIQDIEDMFSDVLTKTNFDGEGQQLDNLGEIIGEPRSGRNDDDYLIGLFARVALNKSEATIEDVIAVAVAVSGGFSFDILEGFPAGFLIDIVEAIDLASVDVSRIAAFVSAARPEGVRGILTFHPTVAFQYDGAAGTGFDEGGYGGALEA